MLLIVPQKARGTLTEGLWDDPNYDAEIKYDGERRVGQFFPSGVRFTGTPSKVRGVPVEKTEQVPHFAKKPPKNLAGTILDMEWIAPEGTSVEGGGSKYVTSISNSSPEEAIAKQKERGWLRAVVFDCLYWKGESIMKRPREERVKYAACAVRTWGNPYVSMAEPVTGDRRKAFQRILDSGGEGLVFKRKDHIYGDARGWVKVKGEATADVVIMGYKDAKEESKKVSGEVSMTKYAKEGLIGAVVCGQHRLDERRAPLVEIATVSGMSDDVRRDLTRHGKEHIGQVIEIRHNGREPTGRFRHPRFKRFRQDKRPEDCVLNMEER